MNYNEKIYLAMHQARLHALIYGTGFVDENTGEVIHPKDMQVERLKNGALSYTYGKMKKENIKLIVVYV